MTTRTVAAPASDQDTSLHRVAVAGAVATGGLLAAQTRVNGELGSRLSDGLLAALVVFASGLVIVVQVGLGHLVVADRPPLLGGSAVAWQQAANGRVRAGTGSVHTATFVNFAAGTAVVAVVALAHGLAVGFPSSCRPSPGCTSVACQRSASSP